MALMSPLPPSQFFPPAESADADGLVGIGGCLSAECLLDAYAHGIFPWPLGDVDEPMFWWSLDPRAIIELDALHVARRLRRTLRSGRFEVTCDRDFLAVIRSCAESGDRRGATWITPRMVEAYTRLFQLGHAHSVEVWRQGRLAGGLYGLALGGLFAAESMFTVARDASKVALVRLVEHLRRQDFRLLDIQQLTPHTARLGAVEIPRREYLARLERATKTQTAFDPSSFGRSEGYATPRGLY